MMMIDDDDADYHDTDWWLLSW